MASYKISPQNAFKRNFLEVLWVATARYILFRAINAFIVLFIVMLISSILFNAQMEQQKYAEIRETVAAMMRNPELVSGLNRTEIKQLEQQLTNELIEQYGLNKPYWIRVFYRVKDIMLLDLGHTQNPGLSQTGSTKVSDIIMEALPRTIILFTTGQIIIILIGLFLGLKAAQKAGSLIDRIVGFASMISYSLPMWWLGMIMILIFSYKLHWFPSSSLSALARGDLSTPLGALKAYATAITLPLITLVIVGFGGWAYITRNIVLATLQEDFVMAARAKGIPERKVIYGHVLRASSPPIVTMSIISLLNSLSGAMISEAVFTWPGMGRLYYIALQQGDVPVLLGLTFVTTFLYVFSMVLVDLIYGLLDPRVRVGVSSST